jgi:hypothetical protein
MSMDNRPLNGSSIVSVSDAPVICKCVVDLVSKKQRPFLFRVTVTGDPPHAYRRIYDITAISEDGAAMKGLDLFEKEFSHQLSVLGAMV